MRVKNHRRAAGMVLIATLALHATASWAECHVAPTIHEPKLSAETLAVRGKIFMSLCSKSTPELIDANDATLQGRIVAPEPILVSGKDFYPEEAIRAGITGKVVLVALVEADGKPSQLGLIQSSGSQVLDRAAVTYLVAVRSWRPGKLDGVPTRMLVTFPMSFHITDVMGP